MSSPWRGYALAIRIVTEITVMIAVPALGGAFLGRWLDTIWGTRPWMFILCLLLSAGLTVILIRRKAPTYVKML